MTCNKLNVLGEIKENMLECKIPQHKKDSNYEQDKQDKSQCLHGPKLAYDHFRLYHYWTCNMKAIITNLALRFWGLAKPSTLQGVGKQEEAKDLKIKLS